jgi:hypothetical protein
MGPSHYNNGVWGTGKALVGTSLSLLCHSLRLCFVLTDSVSCCGSTRNEGEQSISDSSASWVHKGSVPTSLMGFIQWKLCKNDVGWLPGIILLGDPLTLLNLLLRCYHSGDLES